MKAKMVIDGNENFSIDLGYEDVCQIISNLPDIDENNKVFSIFATHPSVSVRENVAGKDRLNEDTVHLLAKDTDAAVLRVLVRSDKAKEYLSTEELVGILNRDVDAAENIAGYVEMYESADTDELTEALVKHKDPRVRNSLASNSGTSKKALKVLLKDEDPRVRASAQQTLS